MEQTPQGGPWMYRIRPFGLFGWTEQMDAAFREAHPHPFSQQDFSGLFPHSSEDAGGLDPTGPSALPSNVLVFEARCRGYRKRKGIRGKDWRKA